MADLPSIEKGEPPELQILDAEPYDDDVSSDAILITSFEVTPNTTGELAGGSLNDEVTDPHYATEEGSTYAEIISHARVRAALKRPIRLCKYHSIPTCLLVLEINLFETAQTRQLPRLLRFKAVDVTVEFKPAPSDTGSAKASKLGPEVVMFCPETYSGEPTVVTHYQSSTICASIDSSSSLPAGLGVGMRRTSAHRYRQKSACTIAGRTLLLGSAARIIKWEISEDAALKSGVPKSLRFVMAVTNPVERAFNIKLNFSASLGFGDLQFRVKKEKSVMATRVDPGALRELAKNHMLGEAVGRVWQCMVDEEEVEDVDLEKLTNLKGSTVGRTHGFS
jgi:hypothetical protein